jgi:hypothetical protein
MRKIIMDKRLGRGGKLCLSTLEMRGHYLTYPYITAYIENINFGKIWI